MNAANGTMPRKGLSRRELLRTLVRGAMFGGLAAVGARALARRGGGSPPAASCLGTCGGCGQRPFCARPEAARARKERRHGTR